MRNGFLRICLVTTILFFFSVTSFAQTVKMKGACKKDSAKVHSECKAKQDDKACCMKEAKPDSCCNAKMDSVQCPCQKAGKPCDGKCKSGEKASCMKGMKPDSCCKAKMDSAQCPCQKAGKPCDGKCKTMKKHELKGKKEIIQKICPVTGEPINQSVYTDFQGKRIYFCCESCKAKFLKSPDAYLKKK